MSARRQLTLLALIGSALLACGTRPTAAAEPLHPLVSLERVRAKTYATRDGKDLLADIYRPPGEGPFPCVLMVHGGAWATGSKWHMLRHANQFAQHGYAVVAINYRLAPAHKFPAQLDDCRAALSWMTKHAHEHHLDAARIGAMGYSAGGHLVALLGVTEASSEKPAGRLKAIVAGGAPCNFDWLPADSQGLSYFLGGSRHEKPEAYRRASPVSFVTPKAPPFFFFHGSDDKLVPISSSRSLHTLLQKAGVESSFRTVDGKGHLMTFHDPNTIEQAIRFMDRHVKESDGKVKRSPNPQPTDEVNEEPAGSKSSDHASSDN